MALNVTLLEAKRTTPPLTGVLGQTPSSLDTAPTPPALTQGETNVALVPSLFQKSVVSARDSLTSMASSSDSMSGNSTSITVVFI